jgi:competence protein ComGC
MNVQRLAEPKDSGIRAFTLIELIVMIAVVVLLLFIVVPARNRDEDRSRRISCASNLKHIALAFKTFALDAKDQYPMNVEAKNGGSLEAVSTSEVFRHFQALSNELSTPILLVCPTDSRKCATNFTALANSNVTYFIGLDAKDSMPNMFLSGDRNLTNGTLLSPNRILVLTTNRPVGWNHEMHKLIGNIALSDSSVQGFTSSKLSEALINAGETNRIAIP